MYRKDISIRAKNGLLLLEAITDHDDWGTE